MGKNSCQSQKGHPSTNFLSKNKLNEIALYQLASSFCERSLTTWSSAKRVSNGRTPLSWFISGYPTQMWIHARTSRTNERTKKKKIPSTHIYPFCHSLLALQNRQPSTMHHSNGEEGRQLVGPWDTRREEGGGGALRIEEFCAGHLAIVNSGRCLFGSIP